jgi:glycosyltransferase involved in cell wall biosynthesis
MKILYIITQGENGGAQKNVLDIAVAANDVHQVHVATGEQPKEKDAWLFESLKKKGFNADMLHIFPNLVREISPAKELRALTEIYKFIKAEKFDLVHLHSSKAGTIGSVAARLAGARVVYTVHGFIFQEPMSFLKKAFYVLAEFMASLFIDYHICVSQKDLEVGQKFLVLRNLKNVSVVYNGINDDPAKLLSREAARKYILEKAGALSQPEIFIFGTIANLYATKGLTYYIQAVKILKTKTSKAFVSVVMGDGELRKELEEQIAESGLQDNFKLLGYTANAYSYLTGLDTFVLPSVKEGLPYALAEASLAGLPIIASRVGGIPEMGQHIKIQMVEPKNPEALVDQMLQIIESKNIESFKSEFSPAFSLSNMTSKTLEIYQKVTSL